jgi:hypothetical protein
MKDLILGAIAMASLVAGLFFFRFWKTTNDRFFLFFAIAFWIEAINRMILGLIESNEYLPVLYIIRFLAFSLILFAIIDKNRSRKNTV